MSDRGQHILHMIPIGGSTQRTQKYCVSRAKVVDDASRIEWQTEWRRESHQLWCRQDADSRGCEA